ncbi:MULTISPECIES: hypothetical protein [Sphingobacterium]|uniref:hypothetical protein n=1 Tax=Sphingobacterium TaxID=28453 RepID=UPI0024A795C5|nr:hypothetical protein [Sphingobacterium thalpophilum]
MINNVNVPSLLRKYVKIEKTKGDEVPWHTQEKGRGLFYIISPLNAYILFYIDVTMKSFL